MKLLVINGPNLNLLGVREPDIYGRETYDDLVAFVTKSAADFGVAVEVRQTNHEGLIVDWIQEARGVFDGLVINPAAYTQTSVAILDALKAVCIPTVEVHISDVSAREDFRQRSFVSLVAEKTIAGHGFAGYAEAIEFLLNRHKSPTSGDGI